MIKRLLIIIITILVAVIIFWLFFMPGIIIKEWGIKPRTMPELITDKELAKHKSQLERIWGFCNQDLSAKDMSQVSLECISYISFDQSTKWPNENKLPKGFNPDLWLRVEKNPGLSISKIHEKGVTGKGVSVAIIDKPILSTHKEFKNRITYIEVGTPQTKLHFHGIACASILAGKTCGVAPDAKLYYFAIPDINPEKSERYMIDTINKIIEINKSLPEKEKIRIVSMSVGVNKNGNNWDEWEETWKRAQSNGIIVIFTDVLEPFTWGGCYPSKDRDNPANYILSNSFNFTNPSKIIKSLNGNKTDISFIIVPSDFRTTASNNGDDQYVYWAYGGFSMAIPYIAGLAALALQVNPDMTFDQIINKIIETKTVTSEGRYIINPKKFIDSI